MNIYDLRRNSRRVSMTRRITDRRKIPYPFGSKAWIKNIKKHYLAWPKFNRRDMNRRGDDRRVMDRRQQQFSEQRLSEKKFSMVVLTREERDLIKDLYLSGLDN